ncbi:MAG: putative hydrolase [Phycisphaerales bacterium]|nr:putative hydrolase [Phycisphaerales bacterium]
MYSTIASILFLVILLAFAWLDAAWWRAADQRLKALRAARFWRILLAAFMSLMLLEVLLLAFWRTWISASQAPMPMYAHAVIYLWHFLFLPIASLVLSGNEIIRRVVLLVKTLRRTSIVTWASRPCQVRDDSKDAENNTRHQSSHRPHGRDARVTIAVPPMAELVRVGSSSQESGVHESTMTEPALAAAQPARKKPGPSRRQVLAAAAMAVPPIAACAVAGGTLVQMDRRRLKQYVLRIPQLPQALDGLTIAQVSDTHIGKFLHPSRLPGIADDVNALNADFVVFTGDLIDMSLSDLPHGIKFLQSLKARCGVAICEGNHDLFEDRGEFERRLRPAGLPFLLGGEQTFSCIPGSNPGGRDFPVQFLGLPWNQGDQATAASMNYLRPLIRPDAFPILLAHHPHAFDPAADAGIPLTLSGHTHGGQLMLTDQFGAGSVRFRYISGLYQKPGSSLIVNNGIGNWFPLRWNAPAEIVHVTLRSTSG